MKKLFPRDRNFGFFIRQLQGKINVKETVGRKNEI